MRSKSDSRSEPGVYRVSRGWKVFFAVVAVGCVCLAAMFLFFALARGNAAAGMGAILLSLFGSAFLLLSAYLLFYVRRFSVRVNDEAITVEHVTIRLSDVSGYRIITSGYVPTVVFLSKNPAVKKLSVELAVERRAELFEWIGERLTDVDAAAAAEDLASLIQDDNLGVSTEDKFAYLKRMRNVAKIVNGIAVALALLGVFRPRPYELVIACLAAYPFLALVSIRLSRGVIRFDTRQKDIHPSVLTGVLAPAGALALRALFDFQILAWGPFWLPFGFLTGLLFLTFLIVHRGIKLTRVSVAASVFFFVIYGYGATVTLNGLRDSAPSSVYPVQVLDKRVSSGKTTSYYLEVSPWGLRDAPNEVEVGSRMYARREVGDSVEIRVHEGILRLRWFEVRDRR